MPRVRTSCETLTIGQLARRWGVSADRVRKLILAGLMPGAFAIPSAGRYGATIKVPLTTVVQAEAQDWAIVPEKQGIRRKSPRRQESGGPALRHFPKLAASDQPGAESLASAPG
jgi:hypothetical protein